MQVSAEAERLRAMFRDGSQPESTCPGETESVEQTTDESYCGELPGLGRFPRHQSLCRRADVPNDRFSLVTRHLNFAADGLLRAELSRSVSHTESPVRAANLPFPDRCRDNRALS